jgi:hypothetical protein
MTTPRRLTAIVIDDKTDNIDPDEYKQFVKLDQVESYIDIQLKFVQGKSTSKSMAADLLLIDVNQIESMPGDDGFKWTSSPDVKPLGPLLALPFIARDLCAFSPYSNYWRDKSVMENGFVMLSVALLFSVQSRRSFTLNEAREEIEKKATINVSPQIALREALRNFRALMGRRVQFVDIGRLYKRLEDLQETHMQDKREVKIPLRDPEVLSVDFYLPSGELERIEISSLFADLLDFDPSLDPVKLDRVFSQLQVWRSRSVERSGPTLYEMVRKILSLCEKKGITTAVEEIRDEYRSEIDRYLLKRMTMEFAWVQAWYEELTRLRNDDLSLIARVRELLGLKGQGDESIKYRRLLGVNTSGKDAVSEGEWRTPFKVSYKTTNDAYQLDHNEPGTLTNMERGYCIQFATEVLRWDGREIEYRNWMLESVQRVETEND